MSAEPETGTPRWIGLRRLPRESDLRAVIVSLVVCLACSAAIAFSVSLLRPYREANRARDQHARIVEMIASVPGLEAVLGSVAGRELEARVIDLETGRVSTHVDPDEFDPIEAARDQEGGVPIASDDDIAGLGRRARHARVYELREAGRLRLLVLPIEGAGYVSKLRGYLALDADLETIRGLSFYEHAETPGLGAEIDSPAWRAQWAGKRAFDEAGQVQAGVARDAVEPTSPEAPYRVDGITGATRTGEGVTRALHYWLGPHGFGPYLAHLADSDEPADPGSPK